jgi:hypothetical protein
MRLERQAVGQVKHLIAYPGGMCLFQFDIGIYEIIIAIETVDILVNPFFQFFKFLHIHVFTSLEIIIQRDTYIKNKMIVPLISIKKNGVVVVMYLNYTDPN